MESEIKEEPLFSFKNFFRPTSHNVAIWCNAIKAACITLITFSTTLLVTNPYSAITMILIAVIIGGVAESLILFTKEKPMASLVQALEDVKEEKIEELENKNDEGDIK